MRIIALEEHCSTPAYIAEGMIKPVPSLAERSKRFGYQIFDELADIGPSRIKYMDASGIDVQVLSLVQPGSQNFDGAKALAISQDANDTMAEACRKYPGRFAGFATLPVSEPEVAVKELERCVNELGFKGALINGHQQGEFLDAKKFWPIFEAAEALDVPIYLHPTAPHPDAYKAYFDGYEELHRAGWGFMIDTSCHFLRIMFSGAFDAYPKLKFILGHLGEGLPFAMHRLDDHTRNAAKRKGLKKTALEYMRDNVWVTTSGNWYEPAFVCTMMAMGVDKILFAIDWPYEPNTAGMAFLNKLSISDGDREKIAHLNAEKLLKM